MSKITFEYDESGKDQISAFAFNTGHLIEELINDRTKNLNYQNQLLEAKILDFNQKLSGESQEEYEKYFGINKVTRGKI